MSLRKFLRNRYPSRFFTENPVINDIVSYINSLVSTSNEQDNNLDIHVNDTTIHHETTDTLPEGVDNLYLLSQGDLDMDLLTVNIDMEDMKVDLSF